jgi:serine/threonine protein kinase
MGSSGYTAPEVFGSIGYDHRADIWSLGIVLWELFLATGDAQSIQNPFMGACGDEVIHKAERGERPEIPPGRLPFSSLGTLLQRCWDLDPYRRPSAADIAEALAYIMREESTGPDKKDCGGV